MTLPNVVDFAHHLVGRALHEGGFAIDATVGNGHDTLFLAEQVGAQGRVLGFDVQSEALDAARQRLESANAAARVTLVHAGHETMTEHVDDDRVGGVDAIMFNLGYLPGSDHETTTQPDPTRTALGHAAELIRPGGVITVVAYTGHKGGREEAETVARYTSDLDAEDFQCLAYRFVNQPNDPPELYMVEKRGTDRG